MRDLNVWQWLFLALLLLILLSPLAYWGTGVGQAAGRMSAEVTRAPDGTPLSSPKAEALHRLALPMRVERLLVYPLLPVAFQWSGGALALRRWVEGRLQVGQAQGFPLQRLAPCLPLRRWAGRLVRRDS